jgi:hypothetical protein
LEKTVTDPLIKARETIEDAIREIRATQVNTDSKLQSEELEILLDRLYALRFDLDEVLEP